MKHRNILNLGIGLCLMFGLAANAAAADYTFEGAEKTSYYPSTGYEAAYGSAYNYGGRNVIDYEIPDLAFGVRSNTSVGPMEQIRVLDSNGYVSGTPLTGGGYGVSNSGTVQIPGVGEIHDASAGIQTDNPATISYTQSDYPIIYQKTAFTSTSGMTRSDGSIGTVSIPSLGISMKLWNGETNASMAKGLGHYDSTSGWNGNVGVCGHNRGARYVIGSIKDMELGDTVTYTTVYGTRTYAVSYVGIISNTDWSFLQATADNRITITTCLANQPSYRVVVQAVEVK